MDKIIDFPNVTPTFEYREDGAIIFHHPPKFTWHRNSPVPTQAWRDYSIYLHVPFCRRICTFCTFERKQIRRNSMEDFLELLDQEMDLVQNLDDFEGATLRSVYLGGGTASLMPNEAIGKFLQRLQRQFGLHREVEVTLECEPGTKTLEDFRQLKAYGVNRISIGVQAFQDHLLKSLNRAHSVRHSLDTIKAAQDAGFENVHIDLMYGLPGQTFEEWQASLEHAVLLGVKHISTYQMIVFQSELLFRKLNEGQVAPIPPRPVINEMQQFLLQTLTTHGYERYSLTEFSKPGFQCEYVTCNWDGSNYLGFGPGAYSRNNDTLWENDVIHVAYKDKLNNAVRPVGKSIVMRPQDVLIRDIGMGLCLLEKDLTTIAPNARVQLDDVLLPKIQSLVEEGLVVYPGQSIRLTEKGIHYATHVMKYLTL